MEPRWRICRSKGSTRRERIVENMPSRPVTQSEGASACESCEARAWRLSWTSLAFHRIGQSLRQTRKGPRTLYFRDPHLPPLGPVRLWLVAASRELSFPDAEVSMALADTHLCDTGLHLMRLEFQRRCGQRAMPTA